MKPSRMTVRSSFSWRAAPESASRELTPAGIAIVAATYGLARYAYGLFLPDIQSDLALATATMGLIAASSYGGYLVATLIASWVSALTGPRLPVVLGGVAAATGMAAISIASGPWFLAAGVFLAGMSPGLAYPPLSDAVVRLVPDRRQERVYTWINSGTGFGVLMAGPLAVYAGTDWRYAWALFAAFAVFATLWNARLMPTGPFAPAHTALPPLRWRWFARPGAGALFVGAAIFGISTSVYWTFAVDLLVTAGSLSQSQAATFWASIGAAGILGAGAGRLVHRFGLRAVFLVSVSATAAAIATVALFPQHLAISLASGAAFGTAFIVVTALFGIWSIRLFYDRPSAGFGATFFLISLGQMAGPAVAGYLIGAIPMATVFFLASGLTAALLLMAPRGNERSAVPI